MLIEYFNLFFCYIFAKRLLSLQYIYFARYIYIVCVCERGWVTSVPETVLIHSGVPAVHQCGQTRTGANSIFNLSRCHQLRTTGGKKEGRGEVWMERERWHPTVSACAHTHLHTNTHQACQSATRSMSIWGTRLVPFISPRTLQQSSPSCTTALLHMQHNYALMTSLMATAEDRVCVVWFVMFWRSGKLTAE